MTRRFLLLMGLGILGLILNHSATFGYQATFDLAWRYRPEVAATCDDPTPPVICPNYDQVHSATYWGLTVVRRFIAFGVPVFLMVSGYFIAFAAGRKDARIKWPILRARVVGLLIPYLVWSIIIFAGQAIFYNRVYPTPWEYIRRLLVGGATGSYYYIPLLIQLYLLSPILVPLAKKRWKGLLVSTAVLMLFVETLRYLQLFGLGEPLVPNLIRLTPLWFFPRRLFWFALGIVFGFHIGDFKPFFVRHKNKLVVGAVLFYLLSLVEFEVLLALSGRPWIDFFSTYTTSIYAGLFMMAMLSVSKLKLPYSPQIMDIGAKAFGIYLIHEQVLELVGTLMFRFAPWILGYQILYQPIMIVCALGVPLFLMWVVSRSPAKKLYKYSFG
ncbi:acyltransferase [Candidatus Leptofilum sp.]|uniref:acyltransferase n=1 Tax=Candidatus Leptofilum sp. TaxID=3241576 RepID=UPI003B59BD86